MGNASGVLSSTLLVAARIGKLPAMKFVQPFLQRFLHDGQLFKLVL